MNVKSASTLIIGVVLIAGGALFLLVNLAFLEIAWWSLLKMVIPCMLIAYGGVKLWRHFTWSEEELVKRPGRAGLLSGLFWLGFGSLICLDLLGEIEVLPTLGLYWPVGIILFGALKVADYFRFDGRIKVRFAEIVGVVFVCCFGLASAKLAEANLGYFGEKAWDFTWPPFIEGVQAKHLFESQHTFELSGAERVQIKNHYGDIVVEAGSGSSVECDLDAEIRDDDKEKAAELFSRVKMLARPDQGTLSLEINRTELGGIGKKLTSNLILKVPLHVAVMIENDFGDVRVVNREAPVEVDNSYGEVEVHSIKGNTVVKNEFEEVKVSRIQGSVAVTNRRASVTVSDVVGDLEVTSDHYSVECDSIDGGVEIKNHFGKVEVSGAAGPVRIDGEASRIEVDDLKSSLWVRNSHKAMDVENVQGNVEVESSYSSVRLIQISGTVDVVAAHADISCEGLKNGFTLKGKSSQIDLVQVSGSVDIETSLREVRLDQCQGPISVQNEYAGVFLDLGEGFSDPVTASNKNGEIVLTIAEGAQFNLSAQSRDGEIVSDFEPGSQTSEAGMTFLKTSQGKSGPEIKLQTSQSRIQIRKRG